MAGLEIAAMEAVHLDGAAALERQCFSHPWSKAALASELESDSVVMLAALLAGGMVGYIGMRYVLDEGYVNNVAVDESRRRQGIADALLRALVARAEALALATVTLEVRASNAAAIGLYEKHGFRQVGLRRGYYSRPPEHALLMTLALPRGGEGSA